MPDRYADSARQTQPPQHPQTPCTPALQLVPWAGPSQPPGQVAPGHFARQIEAAVLRGLGALPH
jgi:hypothetical protein